MTTVDEDLLLHETEESAFDNLTALDEDLLLGAGEIARKAIQESVDDSVSLADTSDPVPEQVSFTVF
uniref:Uncharacterized protein n=1 Tax=Caenorhabditis japonica TaxID=281687 RepID=A0A8R1HXR3_CAEJA